MVENLFPGYFALVMATGIVSIASALCNLMWIARVLLAINVTMYAILGVTVSLRVVFYPQRILKDLASGFCWSSPATRSTWRSRRGA